MLTVEQALELVAEHSRRLEPQRVPLREAAGLVLAEDVASEVDSPPYDKSMMDGYAIRSSDGQTDRKILEEIAAGDVPRLPLTPGTASRIMTGAPIPEGADAVVPVELTELVDNSTVRLQRVDFAAGQNVLRLGTALRAGDMVLQRDAVVRPIEVAILAEIGRSFVMAQRPPRVAVLTTGNELVAIGERPAAGQIRNSNGPMLVAAAERTGASAVELGIARDDRDELRRWIEQGLAADILVLSGGVSAGKFDLVPEVLGELGVETVFHKISLRPGKPLWFGAKQDEERRVLVFGLPGNPMSSFVCFELFVRPAIGMLAGRGFEGLPRVPARLRHAYDHGGGRAACLPACLQSTRKTGPLSALPPTPFATGDGHGEGYDVEILPWHGSADLATVARANCLAYLGAEKRRLAPGTPLDVLLI